MKNSDFGNSDDELFKFLFDAIPTPILEIGENLIVQRANREARQTWTSIKEGESHFYRELLSYKQNPEDCFIARTFRMREPCTAKLSTISGDVYHIKTSYIEFKNHKRALLHLFDITRLEKIGNALQESEKKYRSLFQNMLEGIFQTRPNGKIIAANPALVRMLGYDSEEELCRSVKANDLYQGESRDNIIRKLETEGRLQNAEFILKRKDGRTIVVQENSQVVRDNSGKILHYEGLLTDISDRKKTEEALRESEEKYRKLVERANDGITMIQDMKLKYVNSKLAEILGYSQEEMTGKSFYEFVWPENQELLRYRYESRIKGGNLPSIYESALKHRDGSKIEIEINAGLIQYQGQPADLVFIRDISFRKYQEQERQKLQSQIQNAQKLKSLEIMAGGIAHDFNNLLMGILGNASLALKYLPEQSPVYQHIKNIEKSSRDAADLTNQMLAYSGKGKFIIQKLNLSTLIGDMSQLLKSTISKKVSLTFSFEENLPPIEADANQIRQVVLNLILNASEAIGENQGKIVVKTRKTKADQNDFSEAYLDRNLTEGDYVVLEICDDGPGMN